MSARELDLECYANISEFEVTLRRIVRWELMSLYGRSWLAETGAYLNLINDRIASEGKKGINRGCSSYLSYLTLGELQTLIFKDFWNSTFSNIFSGKKSLQKDLLEKILPVRNKVAHFRPVTNVEFSALFITSDFFDLLKQHYQKSEHTSFYLSGESQRGSELLDYAILSEARGHLEKYKSESILDDFLNLQWLRAYGVSPGLGIFKKNLFLELYFEGCYSSDLIMNWVEKKEFEVTLATFSKTPNLVRVFIPMILGEKVLSKTISALANVAKDACFDRELSSKNNIFGGASEILIDRSEGKALSFAF